EHNRKTRSSAALLERDYPHVGLRIGAIGDDAAVGYLADEELHHRMIRAHDGKAVERHVFDKRAKGLLDGLERLEMIEMLGVHVGDDRDIRGEFQESAIGFAR